MINETIHPEGFIWNALARGYRFGFESSSDHISTHSSYGIALVERPGREAIIEAFRARRCYAATDNILLVVRCGEHLMGEEFAISGKPTLRDPRRRHRPDRQARYRPQQPLRLQRVARTQPRVDMQWTDADPLPRGKMAYYYVRIQQADTNLAWSSPLWVRQK